MKKKFISVIIITFFILLLSNVIVSAAELWWFPLTSYKYIGCRYGCDSSSHPSFPHSAIHKGVDIPADSGTPIRATQSGTIERATYSSLEGNYIVIRHSNNVYSAYKHMSSFAVTSGSVSQGQIIGYVGSTGNSSGPHLHFEMGIGTYYQNTFDPFNNPYAYVDPNNPTPNPNPPSNASISIDKESVRIGETFKITCSSDTYSQYYLAIFDADSGEKIIAENVSNGVFQNSFLKAGKYNAYMTAYNSQGSVDSNWITFFVFGSPPTKAALSVDKTELNTNDAVTLKSSSDAYYVRIYTSIFKNDNLVYSGEIPYDFIYNVSSNGIYTAHITAYTHEGGVDSNWVTFYVGKYNVSYNANGGNGAPSAQTKIHGKNLTISNSVPTRNGYTFKGWNTNANGTGTSYSSGETYNINSNITLYAQWSLNATTPTTSITATRTTSSVIEVQTTITNLTQSAQCITAVYSNNGTLLEQVINNVNSTTGSITAYFSSDSNASYVKVFLWDSLKGMKPLTNSEKVNI